jgi:LysM repeat protein
VTVAVLLVRSGLDGRSQPAATTTVPTTSVELTQPAQTEPPTRTTTTGERFYRVKSGDTLEGIAAQFGTSVEALLELNPNVDPVALTVGQRIRVG